LLWKDFSTGECGNIVKLVERLTGKTNYNDILEDITAQLNVTPSSDKVSFKQYIPTKPEIGIVRQNWAERDLEYWGQYNIDKDTLKKFNVFVIKHYLSDGIVKWSYTEDNPMYAYKIDDKFKIYRPKATKAIKWRSSTTNANVQGLAQLKKTGDILIITKSLKDVMVLYKMGIAAISPSSETSFISDKLLTELQSRFKKIIVIFDRDSTGVTQLRKVCKEKHIIPLLVNKRFKAKDISDAVVINGFNKIETWLKKEIEKLK
jgi:hypothetical protein